MDDELRKQLSDRLTAIERRLDALDASQSQLREAYARSRAHVRRIWLRPPM
jgi:chaperonin cofactor prefoldin